MKIKKLFLGWIAAGLLLTPAWLRAAGDGYMLVTTEGPGTPWIAIGCALVGLAGICVIGFKNTKRTHLD